MSNILKSYINISIPKTLLQFYLYRYEKYTERQISNLPGRAPDCQFSLNFSESTIIDLLGKHKGWIERESKLDNCEYIPFSSLNDETNFLAININQSDCPVYFGNHETGKFTLIYNTLESFLRYLDRNEMNSMESFIGLYKKAKIAFLKDDMLLVINLLGGFLNEKKINSPISKPYLKQIADALNLLAWSYNNSDAPEQAMETLNLVCKTMFCRNAYLNRIKLNLIVSNYYLAIKQCNQGLKQFSDDYSTTFINLYKGLAYEILEKNKEALKCFDLMTRNVEKSDFNSIDLKSSVRTEIRLGFLFKN